MELDTDWGDPHCSFLDDRGDHGGSAPDLGGSIVDLVGLGGSVPDQVGVGKEVPGLVGHSDGTPGWVVLNN